MSDGHCRGRADCVLLERRPTGDPDVGPIVVVRLLAAADAATDEERCEQREYWLVRPAGDLLLAVDCAAQWGAGNAGPASLSIARDGATLATFAYVEYLPNDACEIVAATLRLPQAGIERHVRHWGKVVRDQCRPSRQSAPLPTAGTGAVGDPVLVLHRR